MTHESIEGFTNILIARYLRDMTTVSKLRWNQYSLRSLFVFTFVVAVSTSWFAWKKQQVEKQRAAVEWIRALHGWVKYDWELSPANRQPPGPAWLRSWVGDDFFAHVKSLSLVGRDVTDDCLECLRDLPQLESLDLVGASLTDAGLQHIRELANLRSLDLSGVPVTDAGLEHVRNLQRLTVLRLSISQVTDGGLEQFKGLTNLEALYLSYTDVTDAGLEHLTALTSLKKLTLIETQVTEEGVKRLQQALPNCEIATVEGTENPFRM